MLFKQHLQREEEFILPPLTLLPQLADGKVSPDMKWAIAMADRVKAEREKTYQEHTQITDAMNALAAAARKAHDAEALEFAQAAVADSLNDLELLEPMSIVIGDYLKAKLASSRPYAGVMGAVNPSYDPSPRGVARCRMGRAQRNPSVRRSCATCPAAGP